MSTIATASFLSPTEIESASAYLDSTRDTLLNAVSSLGESQWHFKTDPGRWSIAEILEHIVIIEGRVHSIVGMMPQAPAAEHGRNDSECDQAVLGTVPRRDTKFEAPSAICPTGQWTPAETVERFTEARRRTLQLLAEAPALRGHVIPHPVLGVLDGYQWILAGAAHGARHTDQIEEVKAWPGFPAA